MKHLCFLGIGILALLLLSQPLQAGGKIQRYMRDHALIWEQLPLQWNEGAFMGNGSVGMMVYVDSINNVLVLHIGRQDVTDHRKAPQQKTSIGVKGADKMVDYCRLDVGKMILCLDAKILDGTFYQDIYNAELTGTLQTDKGEIKFRAYTLYEADVNIVEVKSSVPYRWQSVPGNANSPRILVFPQEKKKYNYIENPLPQVVNDTHEGWWVQPLLAGGDYATYWKEIKKSECKSILYVSIANEVPRSGVSLEIAKQTIEQVVAQKTTTLRKRMHQWWNAYHETSMISIPDKKLENFYAIQMYKLGVSSRPDAPAMDLFGPFFKLSQWPSFWWNLNLQLTYMPVYPANKLEQGKNFQTLMDKVFSPLIQDIVPSKIGDYTWALQNYYSYMRYAGDDWKQIADKFTPKAIDALKVYDRIIQKIDGVYHLIQVESPEYEEFKKFNNSNYGLACLRWLLITLIHCHKEAQIVHPDLPRWHDLLAHLHPAPTGENGLLIASGKPLRYSHRHYSHLLAFYPLHVMDPTIPANRELFDQSMNHWLTIQNGRGLAGYSYTGAASLYAYMGDGNKAYAQLKHFINKPIGISILLPNTMYVESDGKNPVIETPLSAAAATAELFIQSWGEAIRVFPAIPDEWKECSFQNLRAEGGFVVSAQRTNGQTEWISITSEQGRKCMVHIPEWSEIHQTSKGRKTVIREKENQIFQIDLQKGETIVLSNNPHPHGKVKLIEAGTHKNFYGVKRNKGLSHIMGWFDQ